MPLNVPRLLLDPARTTWHITWGTHGARLHGGARPTVDKNHNVRGEAFVSRDSSRERYAQATLNFPLVIFTREQRIAVEGELPMICERGGWTLRACAAAPDHVHVVGDIPPETHGEKVRRLMKRWLGQELSDHWPLPPGATWWAEEGSNIAIHDEAFLNNASGYVCRQRARRGD